MPEYSQQHQHCRKYLTEDCGKRYSHDSKVEHNYKDDIQNHVDYTGYEKVQERPPGITYCIKDSIAETVE